MLTALLFYIHDTSTLNSSRHHFKMNYCNCLLRIFLSTQINRLKLVLPLELSPNLLNYIYYTHYVRDPDSSTYLSITSHTCHSTWVVIHPVFSFNTRSSNLLLRIVLQTVLILRSQLNFSSVTRKSFHHLLC